MRLLKPITCFFLLSAICPAFASDADHNIAMHIHIGTLSEIILPEPYTIIQTAVQIVEMRDVAGRNKKVVTLHPIVAQKAKTNLRIYTRNFAFNIELMLNWPGSIATTSLDLRRFISQTKRAELETKRTEAAPAVRQQILDGVETDEPVTPEDFNLGHLVQFYPKLLKSDRHAPAILKNKVVFAMDYVFHYKGKLVFKATLWNKSKIPYNIQRLTITYKEREGLPLLNRHESKSMMLRPFYKIYSRKLVPPGKKSHIIYVTSKISPQDKGVFNCLLLEQQGTRNFDFDIPTDIK